LTKTSTFMASAMQQFFKYQGTGNDFILLDQRKQKRITRADKSLVQHLCDRRFGIGADGLILLEQDADGQYEMIYFNSDGSESTMCGNGGRCFAAFARHLGLIETEFRFLAIDGWHNAKVQVIDKKTCMVELQMIDVEQVKPLAAEAFEVQTGSPHFVQMIHGAVSQMDVVGLGRAIRNRAVYAPKGINVNFVEGNSDCLVMRTYERGVEDETLSCGTGVTAAALAWHFQQGQKTGRFKQYVRVEGGALEVKYQFAPEVGYSEIWLCGPAVRVFAGEIEIAVAEKMA
jgi:diaminopimelate epimerase